MTKAELESMLKKCNDNIRNIREIKNDSMVPIVNDLEDDWDTLNGHDVVKDIRNNIKNLEAYINDINKKIKLLKSKGINISYKEEIKDERWARCLQ